MPTSKLSRGAVRAIHAAVDRVFEHIKARFLGPDRTKSRGDKKIAIRFVPELTLPGLYEAAAHEERTRPDKDMVDSLVRVAEGYLDSRRDQAKTQLVQKVDAFLREAQAQGVDTNVQKVLGGHIYDVWGKVTHDVTRILDTEATHARNLGTLEGITKVNAASGIEDPAVYFVVVRDSDLCGECRRLHLLEDGVTPRVWRLSEVGHQYHKRGDPNPKSGGLHPHCRCTITTLLPGYGFGKDGMVRFIALGHDEFKRQRG